MKYVKFTMSRGDDLTLPLEQADKVLASSEQLIRITGTDGKWDGRTINKAHIVSTERDKDAERNWRIANQKELPPPAENENPIDLEKFVPDFIKRRHISEY